MIELQGGGPEEDINIYGLISKCPFLPPLFFFFSFPSPTSAPSIWEEREMTAVMFYVIVQGGNVVFCSVMTPKWYCIFIWEDCLFGYETSHQIGLSKTSSQGVRESQEQKKSGWMLSKTNLIFWWGNLVMEIVCVFDSVSCQRDGGQYHQE